MVLGSRRWGGADGPPVVCLHGVSQHGGVFESLARRLTERGHSVVAIDLRGHGSSSKEPPWDTETQARDVIETIDALGLESAALVGHSFGGRLAAHLAAASPERVERLALLDPGLAVSPRHALKRAEIERLDWSFASIDGAVNALLSSDAVVAAPRNVVAAFAREDLREGTDGRLRFSFCPSAAVVAWSEVCRPAPPIAELPTLLLLAEASLVDRHGRESAYRKALGDRFEMATVPNGHNVLWESPTETISAIERFMGVPA